MWSGASTRADGTEPSQWMARSADQHSIQLHLGLGDEWTDRAPQGDTGASQPVTGISASCQLPGSLGYLPARAGFPRLCH